MIRNHVCRATACAIVCFSLSAAHAQTLRLEVELVDLETWISNNTASPVAVDIYEIRSASGILDSVNWRSIADAAASTPAAVSAALGNGALTFQELFVDAMALTEANLFDSATFQAGTRWSIGFPFGTSLGAFNSRPFDATFRYGGAAIGQVQGAIILLPVPEPSVITIAALALIAPALAWRGRRSMKVPKRH